MFTEGWHNISNEEYHARNTITSSGLKLFCQNTEKYQRKYITKDWPTDSYNSAFLVGTCVHMMLLEPEKATTQIACCEDNARTKRYKEFVENTFPEVILDSPFNSMGRFATKSGDFVYVLPESTYAQIKGMVASARGNKLYRKLSDGCIAESSGFAQYKNHTVACRGDLRSQQEENAYFIDVKTIDTLNDYNVNNQMFYFGYHLQHLHYLHVANLIEKHERYKFFYFLFIEKTFPYGCRLIHLDASKEDWYMMQMHYMQRLNDLVDRIERNDFYDKSKDICNRIKIPGWVVDRFI